VGTGRQGQLRTQKIADSYQHLRNSLKIVQLLEEKVPQVRLRLPSQVHRRAQLRVARDVRSGTPHARVGRMSRCAKFGDRLEFRCFCEISCLYQYFSHTAKAATGTDLWGGSPEPRRTPWSGRRSELGRADEGVGRAVQGTAPTKTK